MQKLLGFLAAAGTALTLSISAQATPIAAGSQFNINGCDRAIGAATLDQATGLDFTDCQVASPGAPGEITAYNGSGDFAGLSCNTQPCGTIQDILDFATFAPTPGFYNTIAGVVFDLLDITGVTRVAGSANNLPTLIINGTGLIHYAGFDTTPGIFTLTTQGGVITTFSASTVTQAVALPEPSTLLLLAVSLIGLALTRRSRA